MCFDGTEQSLQCGSNTYYNPQTGRCEISVTCQGNQPLILIAFVPEETTTAAPTPDRTLCEMYEFMGLVFISNPSNCSS